MTLQWIPLDALTPHPENSNRMPPRLLVKLKAHIQRTGLYEPLVVRPLGAFEAESERPASGAAKCDSQYQILNGHHRAQVLRELGHTHARCDVWEVDDREARVLLATLNRLEGRDDPSARASLVSHLADGKSPKDLAALLPELADAVERLLKLAAPPPAPLDPEDLPQLPRPMTFFLTEEQHALVSEALREAGRDGPYLAPGEHTGGAVLPSPLEGEGAGVRAAVVAGGQQNHPSPGLRPPSPSRGEGEQRRPPGVALSRADRLERLALWYLEARDLR